uniref:Ovule protein n=1 Tax=Ascaris lumbricoides TaxID=6252 RepID=A0A0M3IX26_ASCLU
MRKTQRKRLSTQDHKQPSSTSRSGFTRVTHPTMHHPSSEVLCAITEDSSHRDHCLEIFYTLHHHQTCVRLIKS